MQSCSNQLSYSSYINRFFVVEETGFEPVTPS